MCENPGT